MRVCDERESKRVMSDECNDSSICICVLLDVFMLFILFWLGHRLLPALTIRLNRSRLMMLGLLLLLHSIVCVNVRMW